MPEGITHNGKPYKQGDVVREHVVLTEMEAKFNNEHEGLTGCYYELESEEVKKKTYAQMTKEERAEYKKEKE
jgi:hypothetical protein